ncbi:hypothetical protein COO60DRAFT_1674814 [Scenedesmus sp. NREL 46B-D3]|nr:hypothetical protein COO60DRAFT_1674814 [Scenedesmus sp. NREL 46B-D3]
MRVRPRSMTPRQTDYEAWLAASGQLAAVAPAAPPAAAMLRRPHSVELPPLELRRHSSSSRVSRRRYSYHQSPSHMPPARSLNAGKPLAMPHSHTAARQYADETAAAAAAAAATSMYGHWSSSRHNNSHFNAVLPSVPDEADCDSSLPADYGSDEFLLDEQVQAMLVDVISAAGGELPAAAPAGMPPAEFKVQQQQHMVRRCDSPSQHMNAEAAHGRHPGMPAAAPAPAAPAGCGDAAADALAALGSYMMRHEQQKQRHQQCLLAAAAAAAHSVSSSGGSSPVSYSAIVTMSAGGASGLSGLAGAVGLSRAAQAKLQELMAAQ